MPATNSHTNHTVQTNTHSHAHILHHVAETLILRAGPAVCLNTSFFFWYFLTLDYALFTPLFHSAPLSLLEGGGGGGGLSLQNFGLVKPNSAAPAFPRPPRRFLKLAGRIHCLPRGREQGLTHMSAVSWSHLNHHASLL